MFEGWFRADEWAAVVAPNAPLPILVARATLTYLAIIVILRVVLRR
jgi:hypothetical protein